MIINIPQIKTKNIVMQEIGKKAKFEFNDISMSISSFEKDIFNDYEIISEGKYKGSKVAIKLIISKDIRPGIKDGEIDRKNSLPAGIQLKSMGKESDEFIKAMSEIYGKKTDKNFTIKSVKADVVAYKNKKIDISKEKIKFELIFDKENKENLYSEIFLDIDLPSKRLRFTEKDQEYQANIIKILTKS